MRVRTIVVIGLVVTLIASIVVARRSGTAEVSGTMTSSVRDVRDRLEDVAEVSASRGEFDRALRSGGLFTQLVLDPTADDIRSVEPGPTTAVTSIRWTDDDTVELEMFTTGHTSRMTGFFGEQATNAFGCARLEARAGRSASARAIRCGTVVRAVFGEPWVEVRPRP